MIAAFAVFELSPESVDAWSRIGIVGFFIVLGGLVLGRKLITMGEKKDADVASDARLAEVRVMYEARLAEIKADRDEWRTFSRDIANKMGRLTDALETTVGRKLPSSE